MDNEKEFLGTEPLGKLLFRLALPAMIAQFINMLYSIVDRIYIGHIPDVGSLALTGVGVCMPIIMLISAFAALISSGGAPRASISMGQKDDETAEKILGGCFTLQILISLVLTVALLLWNRQLLLAFGASENTIEYASSYMSVYAVGTVFVQLTLGMSSFITAQGFAKISMITVLIGSICNIFLDPLFIFACRMGVRGAALATVISQGVSAAWVLLFLIGKKTRLKLKRKNLTLDPKLIFPCVTLGLSVFIMQGSESVISVCFNASLLNYGGDIAVGAMTILTSIFLLVMLPMNGIAQGAQPILSYNFGAGNIKRVKGTFKLLLISSLVYSVFFWALIMAFPKGLASVFSSDVHLIEFTAKAMRVYCAAMLLFGIQTACQMTFVSIGNAACSIIVAIVRKFVLLLPLIYLVPHFVENKTMGVYLAEPIADVVAVTFTAILFAVQFKKSLSKDKNKI